MKKLAYFFIWVHSELYYFQNCFSCILEDFIGFEKSNSSICWRHYRIFDPGNKFLKLCRPQPLLLETSQCCLQPKCRRRTWIRLHWSLNESFNKQKYYFTWSCSTGWRRTRRRTRTWYISLLTVKFGIESFREQKFRHVDRLHANQAKCEWQNKQTDQLHF